ncbi:hypothetical protein [Photobacterium damselae]|uniref:hypothetical protein n=1 Tax=Photobacterium damselae TaxID=38293 RepID=UPI001EDD8053|nr:hypothetical protein [Photobacterium damselae]MCG3846601.1 hypothetical protein [Photobacterium damselae]
MIFQVLQLCGLVNLESHGYDSATATIEGLYAAGWALSKSEPIKITWGKNPTAGMNVKVKDIKSGKQLRTNVGVAGSEVSLSVENTAKVTTTPVNPQAKLSVQATVLATVIV